jgi:septal ring factor EnvC (AmiA/AmiB activator)
MGLWLAMLALLVMLVVAEKAAEAGPSEAGEIVAPRIHLRSGPGQDHPSVKIVSRGARFHVLDRQGEWLKIACGGAAGFVKNRPAYVRFFQDAANPPEADKGEEEMAGAKAEAASVAARITRSRSQVREASQKEAAVLEDLAAVEQGVNAARMRVEALEAEAAQLDGLIKSAEAESSRLALQLRSDQDAAVRRLKAYYKLLLVGRINILASAEGIHDVLTRQRAMNRIVDADNKALERLLADQQRQERLLAELKDRRRLRQDLQRQLSGQVQQMAAEKKRREALLAEIRADKSLQMAALAELQQQARSLDQRMADMKRDAAMTEEPGSGLNVKPFQELKGLLNQPVSGMMVSRFGAYRNEQFDVMNFRSGIDIKAERGAAVRAVGAGRVLFADWFKGYGNMVIIDHGESYYTVYAHLETMARRKGSDVTAGQLIGTVGEAGLEGFSKLYFEVRHRGKPLDPAQWLKSG